MSQRPLKDKSIGFRIAEAKKTAFEQNVLQFSRMLEETKGIEDLDASKITRHLHDAFNKAITDQTWPDFPPFRLYTVAREKVSLPKKPKSKRKSPLKGPPG